MHQARHLDDHASCESCDRVQLAETQVNRPCVAAADDASDDTSSDSSHKLASGSPRQESPQQEPHDAAYEYVEHLAATVTALVAEMRTLLHKSEEWPENRKHKVRLNETVRLGGFRFF
jgi:hypothetical protein